MRYKVGDKVKFLNEEGGGVVSKILSPSMVNVLIDDGFEIPTMINDLLGEDFGTENEATPTVVHDTSKGVVKKENYTDQIRLQQESSRGTYSEGIYFAFVPHNQNFISIGDIDLYVVNNTSMDLLYSFYLKGEEVYQTKSYGEVEAQSMYMVETISREQINTYLEGVVQGIFLNVEDKSSILAPVNTNFSIKPSYFMNEKNFKTSGLLDSKALFISLLPLTMAKSIFKIETKVVEQEKIDVNEVQIAKSKIEEPEQFIQKYKTGPREAVVDLHLVELVDSEEGLTSHDKLSLQLDHFKKALDSAIANYYTKVTFIHGIGQGVLKTHIQNSINDYPQVEYRDGSMKQYGYGATIALIRHN